MRVFQNAALLGQDSGIRLDIGKGAPLGKLEQIAGAKAFRALAAVRREILLQHLPRLSRQAEFRRRGDADLRFPGAERALGIRIEGANALDFVVEKGDAVGRLGIRRENLHDFAAARDLPRPFHHGAALITQGDQRLGQLFRRENLSRSQAQKPAVELGCRAHGEEQAIHGQKDHAAPLLQLAKGADALAGQFLAPGFHRPQLGLRGGQQDFIAIEIFREALAGFIFRGADKEHIPPARDAFGQVLFCPGGHSRQRAGQAALGDGLF